MYGRTFIFVEIFHVNNLLVLEIFMCLIFVGQGYPRKLFNLEHFPIYGIMFKFSNSNTFAISCNFLKAEVNAVC